MTGKRVVFTGGTGKAGRHVLPHLKSKGYDLLNVDLKPFDHPGISTLIADLTHSGQAFNALTTHFGFDGFRAGKTPMAPDAVVHFAAIPRVLIEPDNETFRVNTISTYHVIEAAAKLGVRKIVIASSETTYGVCFAEGDKNFKSFPLEEDYDTDPMDSYGLSKVVNEKTARAFAMRYGIDIYALRIGNVIEPHEYDRFPGFLANPPSRKRNMARCEDSWLTESSRSKACRTARQRPGKTAGFLQNHPRPGLTSIQLWSTGPTARKPCTHGPALSRPFFSTGMTDGKARTCSS